ncbi:TetR family transcriptional regulator [Nocardioides sp. CER19]|uniref:TetR family transcriptional regulator n=1 Tax=Nocardioides sp. CER19 TaxID=3038538 RepID=UPI00244CB856|nr:TetR family transcriptional regulator [Nocardioides sp. CER19]MDH2416468.1 TetR family transcriptional regulator [Nocardioides sp. CER19]
MPYQPRVPRLRWVETGLELLAAGGPEAVRVEAIASILGVTKGGFYGFFANRDALLTAMLDEWERRSTDAVIDEVESSGADVRQRLERAGLRTFSSRMLPVDLAVRSWARQDDAVAERLRRVDNARMGYLRALYGSFVTDPDEIEARSTASFVLAIGRHFLAADHGGRTPGEAAELAFDRLLLSGLDATRVVTASRLVTAPAEAITALLAEPAWRRLDRAWRWRVEALTGDRTLVTCSYDRAAHEGASAVRESDLRAALDQVVALACPPEP